jgi:tetratricopeptide (TPR) repeat protein
VNVTALESNIGVAAYNIGFRKAQGEYIVILDDDSFPEKNAVSRMVEEFEKNEKLGVVAFDVRNYYDYQSADAGGLGATLNFKEAIRLLPGSGEYGLSRICALRGDVKEALFHLGQNIGSEFRKSEKEIMLDPAFSVIENTPEWRSFWKTERYSFTERKTGELEYYLNSGNRDEAIKILDDLKSMYPGESKTLYATALADYSFQKYSDAITILTKLTSEEKNNEAYLRLMAQAQAASGNPSGASITYTQMLAAGIIDAGLYLKRGECYRKTGENEKAIQDLDRYLGFYPDSKEALSLTGKMAAETGDNLKAIDYFSKNLKLHPNDPQCYIDRANSYFNARSWNNAISDYSMSLDIKPENQDVWLNKGISLLNAGKTDDACHDFRKALSLGNKKAASYISSNCIK